MLGFFSGSSGPLCGKPAAAWGPSRENRKTVTGFRGVRACVQQDTSCAFFVCFFFFSCLMPPPAILCYLLGTYISFCGSGSRNQGLFQLNSCSQGNVAKVCNGCPRR